MTIHSLILLIATLIYVLLFLVVIINRPWQRQHKLFVLYLAAATLWAFSTFLLLSHFLIEYKLLLFRLVIVSSMWWAVQLYYFARSFLRLPGGWVIRFGYTSLVVFGTIAAMGYAPPAITSIDGLVTPVYGWWFILYIVPLLTLTGMGLYSLVQRLRIVTDPSERNKIAYLIAAVVVLAVFGFVGITPLVLAGGLPAAHVGALFSACILTYAIVKHELVSIRFVIRQGIAYFLLVSALIGIYGGVVLLMHMFFPAWSIYSILLSASSVVLLLLLLAHPLRYAIQGRVDRLFHGDTQEYCRTLLNFSSKMGNILDLKQLADEMLPALTKALQITYAKLLFQSMSSGDFTTQFTYPKVDGELTNELRLGVDSPIVAWLDKKGDSLNPQQIDSIPELKGLWEVEKEELAAANVGLLCPIKSRGRLIGILALGKKRSGILSYEKIQLVMNMANQAGIIIENAHLYTQATIRANIDELTGLYNHRHFHECLEQEIARSFRFSTIFSLIMLDIDFFKVYNDTYGHLAGDQVLRRIGDYIKGSIRSLDMTFRYGGEEFAVILPGAQLNDAHEVAERIRQTIASKTSSSAMLVTVSLGVANWPSDSLTHNEIIAWADAALYRAKQSGGNRTCLSSDIVKLEMPLGDLELEARRGALNVIYALATTVDAKDHYTYGHSKKVSEYAVAIARELGLSQERIATIRAAGLLHDIGKISIPDSILKKEGTLTEAEWEEVKTHPQDGVEILRHIINLVNCIPAILYHHEHYDGKGYPSGLKGENIPPDSRILAIADAWDAMTSPRPYRERLSPQQALNELRHYAGIQFDPELVDIFCKIMELTPAKRLALKKVLIIEDDPATVEAIRLCFEIHWPEAALTAIVKGLEGIELLRSEAPDVLILDLGLPDIDGIKVLEEIRPFSDIPVLIVSARDTQDSIVKGLELGAEDYIVKPFNYQDLLTRLKGILPPSRMTRPRGKVSGGGLDIDLTTGRVTVGGNPVELTPIEWTLLSHLVENEGRIVPLQRLAKEVWKNHSIDSPTIKSAVSRLRTKLGDNQHAPTIVLSDHGIGYRFVRPASVVSSQ